MWFKKKVEPPLRADDSVAPDSEISPPQRAEKPKNRVRRLVLALVIVVLSLALAFVGFYVISANLALSRLKTVPGALPSAEGTLDPRNNDKGVLNYVLLGTDSRGGNDPGRSDTLMVAHVSANRDKVYLISFPRDLYVNLHGRGMDKINAAYAYGGPALSVATIQDLLGIRINHLAMVDLEGFIGLTDAIGGVDIFNPVASKDPTKGLCYPYGEMHVQGRYALWFTRQRHELPSGDFDRAQRQRVVVKAILARLMKPEVLLNPARFLAVTNQFVEFVRVDETLTPDEIRRTALSMRIDSSSDIVTLQAPVGGFGKLTIDGQEVSIIHVNRPAMRELGQALANDTMAEYVAKNGDITNGMGPTKPDEAANPTPTPTSGPEPSVSATPAKSTKPASRTPTPVPSAIYCKGYNE